MGMRFEGRIRLYGKEEEINEIINFFSFLYTQEEDYENYKYEALLSESGYPTVHKTKKQILFDFTNSSSSEYEEFLNFFINYSKNYKNAIFRIFVIVEYGQDTNRLKIQNGEIIEQKTSRPLTS